MKRFLLPLSFFLLFLVLLIVSLWGVLLPDSLPMRSVGPLQIAPFHNGLSLYQGYRGAYMAVSPFNDYVITNGKRESLLSQWEAREKTYTTSYKNIPLGEQIVAMLKTFTNTAKPSQWFSGERYVRYDTIIQGNRITISRDVTPLRAQSTGITLTFDEQSYVYDSFYRLYMLKRDSEVQAISRLYNKPFTLGTVGEPREQIIGKTVSILHPDVAGIVTIIAAPHQRLFVNRITRMIELEEDVTEGVPTDMKIEIQGDIQ